MNKAFKMFGIIVGIIFLIITLLCLGVSIKIGESIAIIICVMILFVIVAIMFLPSLIRKSRKYNSNLKCKKCGKQTTTGMLVCVCGKKQLPYYVLIIVAPTLTILANFLCMAAARLSNKNSEKIMYLFIQIILLIFGFLCTKYITKSVKRK